MKYPSNQSPGILKTLGKFTACITLPLAVSSHAANWTEEFDDLSNWTGGQHLLNDGVLTLTQANGDSLYTAFEAMPQRPVTVKFRAKPAAGTPGYAALQVRLFTDDDGSINSENLSIMLGGSQAVGYKINQAGYINHYYAGQNGGLFTNDQQWHDIELTISQDHITVSHNGEVINDISIPALSEEPLGNRITLRAESGNWDFDSISVSDNEPDTAIWQDEFDNLDQWGENDEVVNDGVLTIAASGNRSITTSAPLLQQFTYPVSLRVKPSEGTPNYANLQMTLFTGPNGELNQHSYTISTGGNASSHFKLTRAGYDTQYYSGNGHGLLIDAQQWQTLTFAIDDGYFNVYKGEEQVLHHALANLPDTPEGHHLTLKAESGSWDFDWAKVEGATSVPTPEVPDTPDPEPETPDPETPDPEEPDNGDGDPDTSLTAPATPHNLIATPSGSTSVALQWDNTDSSGEPVFYAIYRNGDEIDTTSATTYADTGLVAGQGYDYQISAFVLDNSNRLESDLSQSTHVILTTPQNGELQLQPVPDQQVSAGQHYQYQPQLVDSSLGNVRWFKEYGPDEMTVDPQTGAVQWQVPDNHVAESLHLGVKAIADNGEKITETWIVTIGNVPQIIYVGANEAYTTVAEGVRALTSGGTLIIRNGVYQGSNADFMNAFDGGAMPPAGTANNFTTVIAQDPGQVIFDGRGETKNMLRLIGTWVNPDWPEQYVGPEAQEYIGIRGIHVDNALREGVFLSNAQYMKLIDVAVSDSGRGADCKLDGTGADGRCGSTNIYVRRSNKVLMEDVFTYGHARYQISFRKSLDSVVRRSVSRIDGYIGLEPVGALMTYCSRDIDWQNAIVIDSDSEKFWVRHTYTAASFVFAASDCKGYPKDSTYHSSISLNNSLPFSSMNDEYAPEHFNFVRNSIGWDDKVAYDNHGHSGPLNYIGSYGPMIVDQVTLGQFDAAPSSNYSYFYHRTNPLRISNAIIYRAGWDGTQGQPRGRMGFSTSELSFDFVNFFDNTYTIWAPTSGNYGSAVYNTNSLSLDPRTHGLRYLPVIDADSPFIGAGKSGARIGAHIENRLGRSGTFRGEPGWNTLTEHALWPYPHEDLIKQKMANYVYQGPTRTDDVNSVGPEESLSGARGFAAPGTGLYGGEITLTSYIWERLGLPCPEERCPR